MAYNINVSELLTDDSEGFKGYFYRMLSPNVFHEPLETDNRRATSMLLVSMDPMFVSLLLAPGTS